MNFSLEVTQKCSREKGRKLEKERKRGEKDRRVWWKRRPFSFGNEFHLCLLLLSHATLSLFLSSILSLSLSSLEEVLPGNGLYSPTRGREREKERGWGDTHFQDYFSLPFHSSLLSLSLPILFQSFLSFSLFYPSLIPFHVIFIHILPSVHFTSSVAREWTRKREKEREWVN